MTCVFIALDTMWRIVRITQFVSKKKRRYFQHYLSDKGLKGTGMNILIN